MDTFRLALKKLATRQGMASLFVCCSLIFITYSFISRPRVMILYSHSQYDENTRLIRNGIMKTLADKSFIHTREHYLRLPRIADHDQHYDCSELSMLDSWQPNTLMIVGIPAEHLVHSCGYDQKGYNLVVSSINHGPIQRDSTTKLNVTGEYLLEPLSHLDDIITTTFGNTHSRISILANPDDNTADPLLLDDITSYHWAPLQLTQTTKTNSYHDWQTYVNNAKKTADVLLVHGFHRLQDASGNLVPAHSAIEWLTQNSPIPVIGLSRDFVSVGGPMAFVISQEEIGESMARLTLIIIDENRPARDVPIYRDKVFDLYINRTVFEKANPDVHLPDIYYYYAVSNDTYIH